MRWAVLAPLLVTAAHAVPGPVGSELRVDTTSAMSTRSPALARTNDDFVVVWTNRTAIFGQRVASTGSPLGSEFQINTSTTGNRQEPSVAADATGSFVVVWQGVGEDGAGVVAQRYDSTGTRSGSEFQVTAGDAFAPRVAMDAAGSFIVVWWGGNDGGTPVAGGPYGVYGQRFDGDGTALGSAFLINTYTTDWQRNPSVGIHANGDFIVAWQSLNQDGSNDGVFGQRFGSNAAPLGSEFRIPTFTEGDQTLPVVATDPGGGFIVVWQSLGQDGSSDGIFARRFNNTAAPVGTEFRVNTYTPFNERRPDVGIDPQGRFTVTWDSETQDGDGRGVFAQQFDSAGVPNGLELAVNTTTTGDQDAPAVNVQADGRFMVVWDGGSRGVFAQRFAEATVTPTPTATPIAGGCPGDCDGDGTAAVNELVLCVDLTISDAAPDACDACDEDGSGAVTIDELLRAVDAGLNGCSD